MERRLGLAIVALGALSAAALAQSQSVVTLPLSPPVKKETKEEKAEPAKAAPKPAEQTAAIAPKPDAPVAPQALFRLPAPAFTTEPIFPSTLTIDPDSMPRPEIDRALLEARQKAAAKPPMPQPKPPVPALVAPPTSAAAAETRPRRGVMEPIDDYRPGPPSSVVVDPSALERTLTATNEKSAVPPMPRAKPAAPTLQVAAATEAARPQRRGVMEPIDDYRPPTRSAATTQPSEPSLLTAEEKPASAPPMEPKPALPKPGKEKKAPPRGEIVPAGDVPAAKMSNAAQGKAPTFRCFVRDVTAHYDRTHIRCYNKAKGKLFFFAVDTNQPISATVVSKGLAAMQTGQPATIAFAPEAELNPANCAPANCRRLIDIQN
jgi:hypothetical protein